MQWFAIICHNLYPARGRKPVFSYSKASPCSKAICHNLYPARGRKLRCRCPRLAATRHLPQPLPRKGTETCIALCALICLLFICHNLYPARGRKQRHPQIGKSNCTYICHNLYPARGRKLIVILASFFKKFNLPQPLPRKGTETDLKQNSLKPR